MRVEMQTQTSVSFGASFRFGLRWDRKGWRLVSCHRCTRGDWLLILCLHKLKCQLESAVPCSLPRHRPRSVCVCVMTSVSSTWLFVLFAYSLTASMFSSRLSVRSSTTTWGQKKLKVKLEALWLHVCPRSSQSEVWVGLSPVGRQWPKTLF